MVQLTSGKKHNNNNKGKLRAQCGFSLIELVIVIAIMTVLVGLIAPSFLKYLDNNRRTACRQSREGILKIYERLVYDDSVTIYLNSTDADKVAKAAGGKGAAGGGLTASVIQELAEYSCPKHGAYTASVDPATSVVTITCSECKADDKTSADITAVDMLGWAKKAITPSDDDPIATPTPEPTATPDPEMVTVKFNKNGHGKSTPPEQVIEKGTCASNPGMEGVTGWTFKGWYLESECINLYDFSTPVIADITLYAGWEGDNNDKVWPYSDRKDWWDPDAFEHGGDVVGYDIGGTTNNMYIIIKTPSGIFTSKNGGQFVFVKKDGTKKIYFNEAMTPEYYSALYPDYLIQLTGTKIVYDISDVGSGKKQSSITVRNISNGDLVSFVDNGKEYLYVWWTGSQDAVVFEGGKLDAIRKYENHPENMYRVEPY